MNRTIPTLRIALALLVTAAAAHAQSAGTGATGPGNTTDSSYSAPPAPTDSLAPAALPATPAPVAPAPGATTPMPTRPHVLVVRTQPVVGVERDQMSVLAAAADADQADARRARAEAQVAIESLKKSIDVLDARIKAARKARNDATRTAAEGERRQRESERAYFEHAQDVDVATIDEAQARGEYARAAINACDSELRLLGRSGIAANDGDPLLFKLEQQHLEIVKARGAAEEHLATRSQALVDQKLRLYRAWADWLGGR